MRSADLFFGDKNEVDRPFELLALLLQPPHSLNVLDAHTFHVLDQEKRLGQTIFELLQHCCDM